MPVALFPDHHWADADGLSAPDPQLAATGYFRNDPDTYSRNLQRWHQRLWSRTLADGTGLELTAQGRGVLVTASGLGPYERRCRARLGALDRSPAPQA
jgi:hypothetical protein